MNVDKKCKKTVSFRFSEDTNLILNDLAVKFGMTKTAVVELLIANCEKNGDSLQ